MYYTPYATTGTSASNEFTGDANISLLWNLISDELQLATRDAVYVSNVRQTFEKNLDFYLRSTPIATNGSSGAAGSLSDQNKRFMAQLVRALKQLEIIPARSLRQAQVGEEVPLPFVSSNERDRSVFDQQLMQRQREYERMKTPEQPKPVDFQYSNATMPQMEELTVEQLMEQRKQQDATMFSQSPSPPPATSTAHTAHTAHTAATATPSFLPPPAKTNKVSTRKVDFADEVDELEGRVYDVPPTPPSNSANLSFKEHVAPPTHEKTPIEPYFRVPLPSLPEEKEEEKEEEIDDSFFLKLKPLPVTPPTPPVPPEPYLRSALRSRAEPADITQTLALLNQNLERLAQQFETLSQNFNHFTQQFALPEK